MQPYLIMFFFFFKGSAIFKVVHIYLAQIYICVLQSGETALDIAMKKDQTSKVTELLKTQMILVLLVLICICHY